MTPWLLGTGSAILVVAALAPTATRRRLPSARPVPAVARVALGVAAAAVLCAIVPPFALIAAVGWPVARLAGRRRAARAQVQAVRHALPDLVDLLRLATTAGMTLAVAHPLVAPHVAAPIGPALVAADLAARRGRPRADAIVEALSPFGDRAQVLAHLLGDHLRYGVPLLPGLERSGLELRLERRRAAELDARRVPVRLLGPLVTCVLPAFALLTVVPLLAASLEALPLQSRTDEPTEVHPCSGPSCPSRSTLSTWATAYATASSPTVASRPRSTRSSCSAQPASRSC